MSRSAGGLLTAQTWPVIPLVSKVWIALRQHGREELERDIVGRLAGLESLFGRELDGLELAMWLAGTFIPDTTQSVGCSVIMRQVGLARPKDSALPTWHDGSLSVASSGMGLETTPI